MIHYETGKEFGSEQIRALFLSVHWESGNYPDQIVRGLRNSSVVISAWDDDRLIGLVRGLDDGETIGFIHYLLVHPAYQGQHIGQELMRRLLAQYEHLLYVKVIPSDPATLPFYEKFGFKQYDHYSAMVIKRL
ncbi:MAG: GNAT family N-acetyltransferase [Eubacteriales bacterium]|nr:GNAT family N-acetyltransferase [Eubacteriales bacterium]